MITLDGIRQARAILQPVVRYTPLDYSTTFSELAENQLYLKLENLQKTGSFKVRGAYNKIASLSEEEKACGVVAASAGNHAQGVAFSSTKAGITSTIVMPEGAPLSKVQATQKYGAQVILHGQSFDEALERAFEVQKVSGATFLHPFDDPRVIEGQGTIGLEVLEQLPDVDAIVCPIGGGGLIAGIAAAIKTLKPHVKVYGVEAAACASMAASLSQGQPVLVESTGTIADGIAVKKPGTLTYQLVQKYVDDVFLAEDIEISRVMLYLLERSKLLVEGSSAAALVPLLYRRIPLTNKKVAVILSGGNVDVTFMSRIIEHGLIESGRYIRIATTVHDKPGNLNRLLSILAQEGANVISIHHHRISPRIVPGQAEVELELETNNRAHIERIEKRLVREGYPVNERM
ncbi:MULTISPECIES: threonine ammonia-lyase [Aneurinibacillus]|uniref:threonine ammonia-lyase n=1 Tax=Aneurinibacillus thermoaerophilus TaxID=143495 RepID=A0A1G7X7A2_ANETH|nr:MULTISPECIES: threonine ammonia-lyase [Aneurinibacillus]AMA73236.1 threonine dehydratase [Aneurinibacillus sp. XH2]MED0674336.1 threonine ammonia-lyase [Aneurinibacillus thermoaerophilus]MED0678354.1 threonine ammonia-lyase [Aneurinibacillus thermoaerophilus]MED0736121.1 threonine ammonia-lyase [Aneurinibacillus thermoaerophilus]MED0756965.1 threonine ammonia-lyase [Aneurinibacillus thermoaerophilus]